MSMMTKDILLRIAESLLKLTREDAHTTIDMLADSCLVSKEVAKFTVSMLLGHELTSSTVTIKNDERLMVVVNAMRHGIPGEVLARYLSWKDFETLSSSILSSFGFEVFTNFRVFYRGKRFEVDILAAKENDVLLIDCKRWNATLSGKNLSSIIERHLSRALLLANRLEEALGHGELQINIFPIILTLYESRKRLENDVPVVPVSLLASFLERFPEVKYQILRIKKSVRRSLDDFFKTYSI